MARYPSDLKTIINRYAGESASIPAARINRDFRIAIVATASEVVADVLATTIRSPKTPAFPEVLVELYENSPKAVRADLFNIIIDAMPEAEPLLPRRLRRRRRRFTAQHVVDVTGLDIKMFGEAIEPMPSVFDAVSSFYARHYRPLLKLPTDFQRNLLTNYSSAGRHIALAQNVVEPDFATKNFEITDNLAIDSGEPPTTVKPQVAEGQEPDRALMAPPRPRYASVRVFREAASAGLRGPELAAKEPFKMGQTYQLEVSVRVQPVGLKPPAKPRRLREPRQLAPVDILVVAWPDDFDIDQPVSSLTLPPLGDSTHQAKFRIKAKSVSQSAEDLKSIRIMLYYRYNLIESLIVQGEVVRPIDDDTSRFGLTAPLQLDYGRQRLADHNDFDTMTPSELNVTVEARNQTFTMRFVANRGPNELLSLIAPVTLNFGQLNNAIAGARKALLKVSSSATLGDQVDGDQFEYEEHLKELSRQGKKLWTLLFDQGPNAAITEVGRLLKREPLATGRKIQVSIEENASAFAFAWALLYDGLGEVAVDGFWGIRYVIEQRLVRYVAPEPPQPPTEPRFELGTMYWKFSQAESQQAYFTHLLGMASQPVKLAHGLPIDDAETARGYLRACTSQVIYFYTHGYTGLPDGQNFGVTPKDFALLYESLPKDSPTRKAWQNLYDDVQRRTYESDESWIQLTFGRLKLLDLDQEVGALPSSPVVILNMCDSAQVTPVLTESFIDFFLKRGAQAVLGTECSIRPVFADFVGRQLVADLLQARTVGQALRRIRETAARRRNLLGLAYTLFGAADAAPWPCLLTEQAVNNLDVAS
jgi:hypothetical protein